MHGAQVYKRDSLISVKENDIVNLSAFLPKVYVESMQSKEQMRVDEKAIMGAYQAADPLEVIERSAKNGTWVFISTLRFPNYWHKMATLLNSLAQ